MFHVTTTVTLTFTITTTLTTHTKHAVEQKDASLITMKHSRY